MTGKLGILAGGGTLPVRIIAACRAGGRPFFVLAFEGQTPPETVAGTDHAWVRLGAAGKAVKALRAAGVEELVLVGSIERPSLASLRPDFWGTRFLARSGAAMLGDDGLLAALVAELEEAEGFRVIGADSLLPEALATPGVYGAVAPDPAAQRDIERGMTVARAMGALDVGQAAVVRHGLVLALEAVEGTDAMLARVADLRPQGSGGVLVKARKPGQEGRVDLPTIGPDTVEAVAAAGLAGIAVEAGGALVIDREELVAAADRAGLFMVGVKAAGDP